MNAKRTIIQKILYALVLAVVGLLPESQAQVLPLDSVLAIIEGQNPLLQSYTYRAKAFDTYVQGARSWMPPTVGGGLFMTPYNRRMADEMSNGEDLGSVMVSVEQMIPNPAKLRAKRDYLAARSSVEQANQLGQFNALRAQAKSLYYEWIVLEKRRTVLKENEEIIQFMIRLAEVRYPYNQSGLGSVYEAQAQLTALQNEKLMIESQIRQKNATLNALMARPVKTVFTVDTTLDLNRQVILPVDTATLASRRSDIRSLDRTIQVMRLNQRQEALMRKPDFGIRYEHMGSLGTMPNQFTLMGMVTIPLAPWASKEYKANVTAMNHEITAMQREREGMLLMSTGMITSMQAEIETKRQQVANFQEKIIPAWRKNYEVTLRAYEQNTAQLPLVVDAWESLNMTQMQYLDTLNELLQMQVTYERELEK